MGGGGFLAFTLYNQITSPPLPSHIQTHFSVRDKEDKDN